MGLEKEVGSMVKKLTSEFHKKRKEEEEEEEDYIYSDWDFEWCFLQAKNLFVFLFASSRCTLIIFEPFKNALLLCFIFFIGL